MPRVTAVTDPLPHWEWPKRSDLPRRPPTSSRVVQLGGCCQNEVPVTRANRPTPPPTRSTRAPRRERQPYRDSSSSAWCSCAGRNFRRASTPSFSNFEPDSSGSVTVLCRMRVFSPSVSSRRCMCYLDVLFFNSNQRTCAAEVNCQCKWGQSLQDENTSIAWGKASTDKHLTSRMATMLSSTHWLTRHRPQRRNPSHPPRRH